MYEFDGIFALEKMERAVQRVRERLLTAGDRSAGTGWSAIRRCRWKCRGCVIEQVDESAVRSTQDVDLAVRRADFDRLKSALESVGFIYRHAASIDMFLDGPDAKARDAVHVVFSRKGTRGVMLKPFRM